ncbi:MAG: ABC transporter permease [Candidatus Nealsonbacteria bacterium]|nr:ABC transporter permease [Candidatus Nealsonbacteria bacterium]
MTEPQFTDNTPRREIGRWEARDWAPLVSLAVLIVFFGLTAPGFFRFGTLEMILNKGAVLAIVAAGLTFVLLCAEIDLSVGMMALWSACYCGWVFQNYAMGPSGEPPDSAWTVAAAILIPLWSCCLLGLGCGVLTVWARLPSFIISLAMMFIAEGLSRWITHSESFKVPGVLKTLGNDGIPVPLPLGAQFSIPYSAVLAAAVLLVAHLVLQHTRFGRYVYMTGGNREAARLAGVRTGLIVIAAMAICAVTAAAAGMINSGWLGNVTVDQNKDLLLSSVACVVLGGTSLFGGEGGIGKTIVGVLTFTVLNVGLTLIEQINLGVVVIPIDDFVRQLATGIVLMVALVINGILAKRR